MSAARPVKLVGPSSRELLAAADDLLSQPSDAWAGRWPRAVALLTRQAVERAMEELFALKAPELLRASYRAQLLCLPVWLPAEQAGRVAYTWGALTNATHHHAYELPPTASELAAWFEVADDLSRTVAARQAQTPPGA